MVRSLVRKFYTFIGLHKYIEKEISQYYKYKSLQCYRVWGDESRLRIGKNVHLNNAIINTVSGNVIIGDESFLGHDVSLLTGTHSIAVTGLQRQSTVPKEGRDIIIGKGVWIATKAMILGPCTIGDNAVIAAGSVVSSDIPENSIYSNHKGSVDIHK